ncbi:MAG: Intracellular proteinase inhibitor [Chlorobi bacterium]|nr:Intracellular proteinase inhibitor [Chlorobiota bacterium]
MFLGLLLALSAAACHGSQSVARNEEAGQTAGKIIDANGHIDSALAALDPQFYVSPNEDTAGYVLGFSVGGGGSPDSPEMTALRSIRRFTAGIYGADGAEIAHLTTDDIGRSGTASGGDGSVMVYARTAWAPKNGNGAWALMSIETDRGSVTRRVAFPGTGADASQTRKNSPLEMSLDAEPRGNSMEFVLTVRRTAAAPEGEYRPNGEQYRIEIMDDGGEVIWSSSRGLMFSQMVGEIAPKKVGEEITYRAIWSGLDYRTHERAAPGRYRIIATLPAKPAPYILREELTWSGR